jgi:AcrR family transcriptional regulator
MRMIADRIEYSATAIYSYFKDKESLLCELCELDFSALQRSMVKAMKISEPVERLEQIGRLFVEFAVRHPNHYRFMFMSPAPRSAPTAKGTASETPTAQEKVYAFIRQAVADVIASGAVRPELRDVDTLTQLVWSAMHGMISLYLTIGHVKWLHWRPLKELTGLMNLVLEKGLAADSPAPATAMRQPRPVKKGSKKRVSS